MRIAALVLGIIGGVLGIPVGLIMLAASGIPQSLQKHYDIGGQFITESTARALAIFFLSVAGIVGGSLALRYPRYAATTMLVAGIAGFFLVRVTWALSGPLLLVGAILASAGEKEAVS